MTTNKLILAVLCLTFLSGCTSVGTHVISNPSFYLSDSSLGDIDLERFDTKKRIHCLANSSSCINYLYAKAYQPEQFSSDASAQYTIDASGNGVTNTFTFKAAPKSFNRIKGTAILLHGFGGSKEAMLVTSIYFRAIGMDVIALDLYGHGESLNDFVFGAKEHERFTKLIDDLNNGEGFVGPVVTVGHSMGALPAAKVALASDVVDGAILLAPMIQFDYAAKFYLAYKKPMLNRVFSGYMDQIVSNAMADKNIVPQDTDISQTIMSMPKPILIVNSDVDTVSPIDHFSHLGSDFVQLEVFEGRNHPSLITFDSEDAKVVEKWLINNLKGKSQIHD